MKRKPIMLMVAIILVALGFRLSVANWQTIVYPDSAQYLHLAHEIRHGALFAHDYDLRAGFVNSRRVPMLYSSLVAAIPENVQNPEIAGIMVSLAMSLLVFIPVYYLTLLLYNRRAAMIACAVMAFHYYVLMYSTTILTESTFTTLFMTSIWAASAALRAPSWRRWALTGTMCGLAYLARDVSLPLVGIAAVALLIKHAWVDRIGWRRVGAYLSALIIALVLVSLPFWVHVRVRTGYWSVTNRMTSGGIVGQVGGNDTMPIVPRAIRNGVDYGLAAYQAATPLIAWLVILNLLFAIGRDSKLAMLRWAWPMAWAVMLLAIYSILTPRMDDARYVYPVMPMAIMLAAAAIDVISRAWKKSATTWAAIGFIVVIFGAQSGSYFRLLLMSHEHPSQIYYYGGAKQVAQDMRELGYDLTGKDVIADKPFVAYYAHAYWHVDYDQGRALPSIMPGLLDLIKANEGNYLVTDSANSSVLNPQYFQMSLALEPIPNARLIYSRSFPHYKKIITVYDCGLVEYDHPRTIPQHVAVAHEYLIAQSLPLALREVDAALQLDRCNLDALMLKREILKAYLNCCEYVPLEQEAPLLLLVVARFNEQYRGCYPPRTE